MQLDALQQLLESRTGLSFQSLGASLIERAVARRMVVHDMSDERCYIELLQEHDDELQQFVEEVSVPETWFFRDKGPFVYLGKCVREMMDGDNIVRLNVLSAACSTGEEPYSIAMTLLDAGLDPAQFHIDAVDISERALAFARQAVYTPNSFRGGDLDFQRRYFTAKDRQFALADRVKATVDFIQGNIMALDTLRVRGPYHIIFCRNVLIYFDVENKVKVLRGLNALLRTHGKLFVGHADTGRAVDEIFISIGEANTFAYRKPSADDRGQRIAPKPLPKKPKRKSANPIRQTAQPARRTPAVKPPMRRQTRVPATANFTEIQQLADRGRLDHAAQLCLDYLVVEPDSVPAFSLLGTIRLAQGDNDAAQECFRKAVYLDPVHYESLTHLAGIAEQAGDEQAAQIYRERAGRAIAANGAKHLQ